MRTNSNKLEDRMVLSRHLVTNNSENSGRMATGGGTSIDLLTITYPMGNLSANLRRSMPSVNASPDGTVAGSEHLIVQRAGSIRHSSFSSEDTGSRHPQQQQQQNAIATADDETANGRFASARSLSPLAGSMLINNNSNAARNVSKIADGCDFGGPSVVDTRQIKLFMKKREDSITTISTELSDKLSIGKMSVINAGGTQNVAVTPETLQQVVPHAAAAAVPPASSSSSAILSSFAQMPRHSSRAVCRPLHQHDTRASLAHSSMSSSMDSTKEECLISTFDHTNPSQRVMVLPRPASIQNDDNYEEERAKTPVPSTLSSPIPSLSLSAWHSISDLTPSARTVVAEKRANHVYDQSRRGSAVSAENAATTDGENLMTNSPTSPLPKRSQSQAGNRKSKYIGELVWQVDDTVFCGGIEAVQNQNLLCRLNIEYIVDLSGQEDDPMLSNNRPRTECPCLCARRTAHSRMTMSMKLKDDSQKQMLAKETRPSTAESKAQLMDREQTIGYFETLIDLIRKARISNKKVLIHSLKGRNRAPAFVAAYLMHCNRITRVQAINRITKLMCTMRPGLCISDNLQRALMRWQFILGIRAESSRLDSQSLNKMFAVKRNAWN